ncbi:non-ribosomal peptide synthetase [Alkalicoccobacillus plakortidis]|uniref:Amino acid adenylation domain-containing protein n=1 Tax=Alkalicoccobacillus plakortidis TaxID=444060 RepID=A0ABT0XNG0_9BACI|nr:non-ribosomal peptide synthetase [Alkalicoccobacillus plakortidis]MCM2677362.1 amino acid adenylation domain-containing protein [Alkalicoccobacillus plakortidis]
MAIPCLVNRTADLYTAHVLKKQPRLKPFGTLGKWLSDDENYLTSSKLAADKQYWQELLKQNEGVSLAEGHSTIHKQFHRYSLDLEDGQADKAYSIEEKLLASVSVYLEHATRKSRVVMGLPLMNRLGSAAITVPTNTMNIVPLQIQITPDQRVSEVMMQVRKRLMESKRHGRYRQEWMRMDLGKSGSKEQIYGPIVNILPFTYEYKFGEAVGSVHQLSAGPVEDLSIQFYKQKEVNQYQLVVDGNPELYTEADVRHHADAIIRIYQQLVETDKKVAELSVISNDEKQRVICDVNETKRTVPKPIFTDAIRIQATKQPDAYALAFKNTAYTYKDVDHKVEQIASLLRSKGVKKNTLIGVSLERSPEMVCLLLATLRIGAAYLPLDPSFPKKRLEYMVQHANVSYVISTSSISKDAPSFGEAEVILLNEEELDGVRVEEGFSDDSVSMEDPAYVMYTSGSTGKPKGVVISRGALNQFLYAMDDQFSLSEQDVFLAVTTIAFDISALELYLPLMSGAKMVLAEQGDVQQPEVLGRLSEKHQVSHLQATPTLWQILLEEVPESLRDVHILVGGEALPDHLKNLMLSVGKSATNLYGPTETTIWSAVEELSVEKQTVLGSPIWNTQLYVLDTSLRPVGPKTVGELYIAGAGLAHGYLGRSSLTATRFIANPFGAPGSRMYQTGDLVRYEENGTLSFQGRTDSQIKLRGYRIELGEVEGVLQSHSAVRHAVASTFGKQGNERIVAYIEGGNLVQEADLLEFAAERLPVYMVPSQVVHLDAIPLTPNGKVDRNSLPKPESNSAYLEPRSTEEKQIAHLMASILELERVGRDDHFFSIGGNSLLAVQLVAKIRNTFQIEMSAGEIFESPTVEQLANQVRGATAATKMVARDRPTRIPLSNEQKRLWFLHQLDKENPVYNIPFIIEMEGAIKPQLIERAVQDVIGAHEPLRTLIVEDNEETYQKILSIKQSKKMLVERWIHSEQKESVLQSVVRYSFDLEKESAIHCQLLRTGETTATLVIVLHHIMADGWSLATLGRDLSDAYAKKLAGEETAIPSLSFQYADYALWQQHHVSKEKLHQQSEFWTKELEGLPEQVSLPVDGKRQPTTDVDAKTYDFMIDEEIYQKLKQVSQTHQASMHMVLQASLASLLTKLGAGTDLAIGTPLAGRSDEQLHHLIGLFINTLVLRTNTGGNPTFTELVERVKQQNMRAYRHSDIPFEQVVESINPKRMPGRNPLFQVMFVLQQTPEAQVSFEGVSTQTRIEPVGSAKFDLTFELDEHSNRLDARIEYRTDLFTEERIADMASQWLRVLRQVTSKPDSSIGALQLISEEKVQELKSGSVKSRKQFGHLASSFEEVARQHQASVALTYKDETLTYYELNSRANQLAYELVASGVGHGDYVAVALSRSLDLATTLLAILKTGAAYVPLDPANPLERLQFIIQDASPSCLVTTTELNHDLNTKCPVIALDLDETNKRIQNRSITNLEGIQRSERDPTYIIYTSGSTGKPKGVRVAHQNVWRLFEETNTWYEFSSADVWSMFHSYAFDFAVWEFWGALLHGAKVVLIPQEEARSPEAFLHRLVEEKVTILNQTPSAFYALAEQCLEHVDLAKQLSLRAIIFGGEALDFAKLTSWYKIGHPAKLINMYGITETTVHVTYAEVEPGKRDQSHIGSPIPDLSIYVLDDWLQPVPDGMTGEMYVSGAGLADGYVGRPSLTAERFIANPFGEPGSRMYRTGDLARIQKNGLLVYMGRSDKQVKVRGHRIELGEIDAAILESNEVKQAATILYENVNEDKQLISYLVMEKTGEIEQLQAHLTAILPEYMMPASYEVLEELPLTTNGKLDEKALPGPSV